jgi:hypothetical protein
MRYVLVAIAAASVAVFALVACSRKQQRHNGDVSKRLRARLQVRSDYVVFVGVPPDAPMRWTRASSYTAEEIVTLEGRLRIDSVRAFVIAYPNMQVLDAETAGLALPDGIEMLEFRESEGAHSITVAEATAGLRLVDVSHGPTAKPKTAHHYRTALRNLSDEPVRVVKFGGFAEADGRYVLNTVTGQFFTADEFVSWYGAPADGWIPPGMEVSDPDNYGGSPSLWAYYCETKSGQKFVTGRVLARLGE